MPPRGAVGGPTPPGRVPRVGEMNFDGRRLVLAAPADGGWHTLIWRRA